MIPFDMVIFEAFTEAHSALLMYRDHGGSAHCACAVAKFLRDFEATYLDQIRASRRKASVQAKRKMKARTNGRP